MDGFDDPRVMATKPLKATINGKPGTIASCAEVYFDLRGRRTGFLASDVPAVKLYAAARRVETAATFIRRLTFVDADTPGAILNGNPEFVGVRWIDPRRSSNSADTFLQAAEDMLSAVSLSYSAVEAWANACCPDQLEVKTKHGTETFDSAAVQRGIPLDRKLKEVLPGKFGVQHPFGHSVGQRFQSMEKVRNDCEHMKRASWVPGQTSGDANLWNLLFGKAAVNCVTVVSNLIKHYYPEGASPPWLNRSEFTKVVGERKNTRWLISGTGRW